MKFKMLSMREFIESLTDSELKNVRGGSDYYSGTCCAKLGDGDCMCGVSRNYAIQLAKCQNLAEGTNCDSNWCCDSCGSTQTGWPGGCENW